MPCIPTVIDVGVIGRQRQPASPPMLSVWPLVLLLLSPAGAIQGVVRTASSGEPIPYATVEVPQLDRRVVADERGFYTLPDLPEGRWTLRVTALGHDAKERVVEVPAQGAAQVNVRLAERPIELAGLGVRTEQGTFDAGQAPGPGETRLGTRMIRTLPALAEADVLRAVRVLPSVSSASDFSSALYTRGGSPDQTLVTLDGIPLFNPYHLGGVFAAIDPSAVASVEVLPGAMPAAVGDRLSGTVELWTRDGGRDRVRGRGAVGLISTRAGVDGPLPGGRGSYLASVRRTYLDLFSGAAHALGLLDRTLPYGFVDGHLKLTHDVGGVGRASASFYVDSEELRNRGPTQEHDSRLAWASRAASVSYRQPLASSLVGELRLAYSGFESGADVIEATDSTAERVGQLDGDLRDLLAAADLRWYSAGHRGSFGVQVDAYRFDHHISRLERFFLSNLFPDLQRTDTLRTVAAYVMDEWSGTDRLSVRGGVRVLHAFGVGSEVLPRLGAELALTERLALSVGAGRYAQAVHSLRDPESLAASVVAYDLLGAVRPAEGLETAEDVVLGAEWRSASTSVRVDAYAKRMRNLLLPPLPSEPLEAPLLADGDFRRGEGSAYGLEALVRHERDGGSVQAAYTLNFVNRTVDGESFPPRFERRHTLDVNGMIRWGGDGTLSARLLLATGQPYTATLGLIQRFDHTPLSGSFGTEGSPVWVLGEHNAERLPGYWRLDVAARKTFHKDWFGTDVALTPYAQILNVFNARNVLIAEPSPFGANAGNAGVVRYKPQLPILPTIGVEWSF